MQKIRLDKKYQPLSKFRSKVAFYFDVKKTKDLWLLLKMVKALQFYCEEKICH